MFKRYKDNRGATAIEYGIIASGIAVAIMAGLTVTGTNTKQTFCTIASAIGAGSGNCSGSSSGGTSSGTSKTLSASSQAIIDSLNNSSGYGSMYYALGTYTSQLDQEINNMKTIGKVMSEINEKDPIVSTTGLQLDTTNYSGSSYKTTKSTPDAETAISNLINPVLDEQNNQLLVLDAQIGNSNGMFSFTTQSGNSYIAKSDGSVTQLN